MRMKERLLELQAFDEGVHGELPLSTRERIEYIWLKLLLKVKRFVV